MTTAQRPLTITITENAANHVKSFTTMAGKQAPVLKVSVKGGGCSGLTYMLDITDTPGENDKIIEEHGVTVCVDKKSYVFLAGTVLDYSGGLNGKGFVFQNPNAKTSCGCGTSFSV